MSLMFVCYIFYSLTYSLSLPCCPNPLPNTVAITQGGAIQLANSSTDGVQGLQSLTMTNPATQPGATILQYAQTSDGQQILVPSNQMVVQGERANVDTSPEVGP